jgi:DNA-binding NarL/FixJ family response regulator
MPCCRVVLADDHVLVRECLKGLIDAVPNLEVVGEADDGLQLLALLRRLTVDIVVLDISMPNLRGIEAIHEIKSIQPLARILVLTMHKELALLAAAMSGGAKAYVLKEDAVEQLLAAIEKVRRGGMYVSSKLSDALTADWAGWLSGVRSLERDHQPLTLRESEILKLVAEGKSSNEIATALHISRRTAEHHRASIMRKLGLKGTADLVKYAISSGYL